MTASAAATTVNAPTTAPNLVFSHFGITVRNLPLMERFYTEVLGFVESDRGEAAGLTMRFLTRDPFEHHQIVLSTGRPESIPDNTCNPFVGACIHHISFRMGSLSDLRDMYGRLERGGATHLHPGNHGVMWAVYAKDPEGNTLEFYVNTPWYITQPFLVPLDFSKSDDELVVLTKELCEASPGYEPLASWRERIAKRIPVFVEGGTPGT